MSLSCHGPTSTIGVGMLDHVDLPESLLSTLKFEDVLIENFRLSTHT